MSNGDECNPPKPGPSGPSRFGPSAIIREGPPSEDPHLLTFFVTGAENLVRERRKTTRFAAVEQRTWLGWWRSRLEFTTVAARLQDISQGGARLVMADPPPAQQIVWLCLGIPDPTECVQAKVLAVTGTPEGDFVVRLAFGTPCPQNLYRVAIEGLTVRADVDLGGMSGGAGQQHPGGRERECRARPARIHST
jgi:hypothetical protein